MIADGPLRHDQQGGRAVADLAGRGDRPSARAAQCGHLLQRRLAGGRCRRRRRRRVPIHGSCPASIAAILLAAADRDHLGRPELRHHVPVAPSPARRAGERVGEPELLPGDHRRRDRDGAHVLHAARDDDVGGAGQDGLRGEVHRLLGGPALPVHGDPGDVAGQPGGQPRGPRDVARLRADRVRAAEDHVVHRGGIHARPLDERTDHVRPQVGAVCTPASGPFRRVTGDRTASTRNACAIAVSSLASEAEPIPLTH